MGFYFKNLKESDIPNSLSEKQITLLKETAHSMNLTEKDLNLVEEAINLVMLTKNENLNTEKMRTINSLLQKSVLLLAKEDGSRLYKEYTKYKSLSEGALDQMIEKYAYPAKGLIGKAIKQNNSRKNIKN